jgi:hypothetical protein
MKFRVWGVKYIMLWKNIILEIIAKLEEIASKSERKDISKKNLLKLLKILKILND